MENILIVMPAIPTRGIAVFPGVKTNIDVGREAARNAVNEAMQADNRIFLVMQMDETVDVPSTQDCMKVGVIARILRSVNVGSDIIRISVEGMERAPLNELQMRDNIFRACIGAPFTASEPQQPEAEAYRRRSAGGIKRHRDRSAGNFFRQFDGQSGGYNCRCIAYRTGGYCAGNGTGGYL